MSHRRPTSAQPLIPEHSILTRNLSSLVSKPPKIPRCTNSPHANVRAPSFSPNL
jgi:hypothetical protein